MRPLLGRFQQHCGRCKMKAQNLTRKEAVLACLDGNKVGYKAGKGYVDFTEICGFEYHIGAGRRCPVESFFFDKDGYFIIQEPLTFDRIRKECEPMKHLLVDGEKRRLYLGFTRNGSLVTDHCKGAGAALWIEDEIKKWKIEKYEGKRCIGKKGKKVQETF